MGALRVLGFGLAIRVFGGNRGTIPCQQRARDPRLLQSRLGLREPRAELQFKLARWWISAAIWAVGESRGGGGVVGLVTISTHETRHDLRGGRIMKYHSLVLAKTSSGMRL